MSQQDTPIAVFEIKEYMVIFRQLEVREFAGVEARIRGIVRCTGLAPDNSANYQLDVYFLDDNSDVPTPVVNLEERNGAIFMPLTLLHSFIDVLRNEKPIYGHLRGDNPEWTSVTTANEPVGEGEVEKSW